jgi:hypothetical protein
MTDTERGELTAAELDLASGGYDLQNVLISGVMAPTNEETTSAGRGNRGNGRGSVSAMYDLTQSRA